MTDPTQPYLQNRTRKAQTLFAGGVLGALLGVGAAFLLWQARERHMRRTGEELPLLSGGDAMKLGMLSFGLLRQIGDINGRDRVSGR
jgi:hypothetical protein